MIDVIAPMFQFAGRDAIWTKNWLNKKVVLSPLCVIGGICVDKIGQPLGEHTAAQSAKWDVPDYTCLYKDLLREDPEDDLDKVQEPFWISKAGLYTIVNCM